MVIRTTSLIPEMREAFFKCYVCGNTASVEIDRGRIAEPTLCTNCNTNHSFALVHNRSQFTDKQMIKLQESPGIKFVWIQIIKSCGFCITFCCINIYTISSWRDIEIYFNCLARFSKQKSLYTQLLEGEVGGETCFFSVRNSL